MPTLSRDQRHRITVELNGRPATGYAEPRMLLSDFLRQELGATGTHVGCEQGVCGACTVRLDGVVVRSCLTLAQQADGARLETVEGLGDGAEGLDRLQAAFRRHHALQCGFCTPGILISLHDLLERNPVPKEDEVLDVVSGHLCRCTGYRGILRAVAEVVEGNEE
ncbi:MAG: (2Fe-2S)-binding protein [Alphaproteobacteria bacterium]|jgi:2-furoyl-CoA dehydrogenase 2Fe-2S iron sulfur subunit|nr:(2Fe-2S)-binding protein [Alphaproteobacteria bacterium]